MNTFKASVQYNDMKGSAAADNADMIDATKWLKDHDHITDECVIGISMAVGANNGVHRDPVSVKFLVSDLNGDGDISEMLQATDKQIQVKEIGVEMNVADFFALFKRLEITLSSGGLLEGKNYTQE